MAGYHFTEGIENAPATRLSNVVVQVLEKENETNGIRDGEYIVETNNGEQVKFIVWERHNNGLNLEPGETVILDDVSLSRWETNEGIVHQLGSTPNLTVSKDSQINCDDTEKDNIIEDLIGIGGATESDAQALASSGYTAIEDLKEASLEDLREISNLNDGTALRIVAELN